MSEPKEKRRTWESVSFLCFERLTRMRPLTESGGGGGNTLLYLTKVLRNEIPKLKIQCIFFILRKENLELN